MTAVTEAVALNESEGLNATSRVGLLERLLRWRWLALCVWAAITCAGTYSTPNDWSYFAWGGKLLFGNHHPVDPERYGAHVLMPYAGGFHIFANYHVFQMGPLALLSGGGLAYVGPSQGHVAAVAFIELLGVLALFLFERTALALRARDERAQQLWVPLTTLVGGFVFLQVWSELSGRWAHLDDGLAVATAALACWAIARRSPGLAGAALGLALASKPWAVGFVPLVLVFSGRDRLRAAAALTIVAFAAWGPFLIADWRTIHVGDLPMFIQPASPLRTFGVDPQPFTHASQWRLLQFGLELIAVGAAIRWRNWGAALLVCLATRLIIDPMNFAYYEASLAAGAIAYDLFGWRRPMPLATLIAASAWVVSIDVGRWSQGPWLFSCFAACLFVVIGLRVFSGASDFGRQSVAIGTADS